MSQVKMRKPEDLAYLIQTDSVDLLQNIYIDNSMLTMSQDRPQVSTNILGSSTPCVKCFCQYSRDGLKWIYMNVITIFFKDCGMICVQFAFLIIVDGVI